MGDVLAYIHTNQADSTEVIADIHQAYEMTESPVCSPTLIMILLPSLT